MNVVTRCSYREGLQRGFDSDFVGDERRVFISGREWVSIRSHLIENVLNLNLTSISILFSNHLN